MNTATSSFTAHLTADDIALSLSTDVLTGLGSNPKTLPPKWFYDAIGSELFEQITRLVEYYPTEAERDALRSHSDEIAALADADTLVELGSGASDKTTELLDAMSRHGGLRRYVPFDVSDNALRAASSDIACRYPGIHIDAIVGDFDRHLGEIPRHGRRLVAFLGGTIGNYDPMARAALLHSLGEILDSGETLLVGTDLVKDPDRLVLAYDDPDGVTAEFNKNVLSVINRELDGDFVADNFEHVALWDELNEWIEMRLRSTCEQSVHIRGLGTTYRFAPGEEMRTEISAKFRKEQITAEFGAVGLELAGWWTDAAGDFAVSLYRKV